MKMVLFWGAVVAASLALARPDCWFARADAAVIKEPPPGLLVICVNGGVFRKDGHLGSGGPCVIMDKNGERAYADAVLVYDAGGSP